jgi:DNA-3-methyladenine glycosylase II
MSDLQNLTILTEETYEQGVSELSAKDSDLAGVILKWGNPPFWTHIQGFAGIVIAILAQQVSLESAKATFTKLEKAIGTISPEGFMSLKNDLLKAIGFSHQKASYVRGIACKILTGAFDPANLNSLDDDAIRKRLMEFRGIGPWTADTYLLFSMRRPDAWPSGDLALEKAIQELRGLASKPCSEEANSIATYWQPWRAVAARILWHHYLCERGRYVSA